MRSDKEQEKPTACGQKILFTLRCISNVLDPRKEFIAEETDEELLLMKDKEDKVIGFERLNYSWENTDALPAEFISV